MCQLGEGKHPLLVGGHENVTRPLSLIIRRSTSHLETSSSSQVVVTLALAQQEVEGEESVGQGDASTSTLPKECNEIGPRVGCHLRKRNPPPLKVRHVDRMKQNVESRLEGIVR